MTLVERRPGRYSWSAGGGVGRARRRPLEHAARREHGVVPVVEHGDHGEQEDEEQRRAHEARACR